MIIIYLFSTLQACRPGVKHLHGSLNNCFQRESILQNLSVSPRSCDIRPLHGVTLEEPHPYTEGQALRILWLQLLHIGACIMSHIDPDEATTPGLIEAILDVTQHLATSESQSAVPDFLASLRRISVLLSLF